MSAPPTWWCEAYGPPPDEVPAARWPRCFMSSDPDVRCSSAQACADGMAAERRRAFARINELAVDGGEHAEVFRYLAEEIPLPGMLLGGPDTEETR